MSSKAQGHQSFFPFLPFHLPCFCFCPRGGTWITPKSCVGVDEFWNTWNECSHFDTVSSLILIDKRHLTSESPCIYLCTRMCIACINFHSSIKNHRSNFHFSSLALKKNVLNAVIVLILLKQIRQKVRGKSGHRLCSVIRGNKWETWQKMWVCIYSWNRASHSQLDWSCWAWSLQQLEFRARP